jgi:hypothetical protein
MSEANIWQPRTVLQLSADTKRIEERLTATTGQSLFTITTFAYVLNTGALEIHKNGLLLTKGIDWVEGTTTTFSLTVGATAGDQIVATGYVGITADVDVRDTDIFISNYQAIRDYVGIEVTLYAQGRVTSGDNGASFFQKFTGAAPGTFVDNNVDVVIPTGGDGSIGWLKNNAEYNAANIYANAVNRTQEKKNSDLISVFDFMTEAEIADVKAGTLTLDVTSAWEAAAIAGTIQGKHVFMPAGNHLTGSLTWPGLVGIFGEGVFSSILSLADNSDDSHLKLESITSYFNIFRDFSMEGNSANQVGTSHGINMDKAVSGGITAGAKHKLTNIWVKNYLNHGVVTGGFANGTILERVFSNFNQQFGFSNFAGDVVYSNSQAFNNELTGFNEQGVGTQYSNCKAWLNGANGQPTGTNHLPGFRFRAGARNITLSSCYSQENWGHGFWFDQCSGVTGVGLVADGNSITVIQALSTQRIFDGFHFTDADDCVINGHCGQFYIETNATWKTQRFGVYVDALSENNSIDVGVIQHDPQVRGASTGEYFLDATGALNNKVIVRGQLLTMPDVVSTVAGVSVSDEQLYGTTLLDGTAAFTQVTFGAGATVPPSGVRKLFRTIDATNVCQIVINNYIHGILTLPMATVGDYVLLESNGSKWFIVSSFAALSRTFATSAQLANIAANVNTSDKYQGKEVFDTTLNKPVYTVGSTAGSVWNDAVGVLAHTPV